MPINLQLNQRLIIGKQGNQAISITDPTVSRRHCALTRISQTDYLLEDIGSTNGTYANGLPVVSTHVNLKTAVSLGNFQTTVGELLGVKLAAPANASAGNIIQGQPPKAEKTVHIGHLENIFENYRIDIAENSKKRARMQINRMMPMLGIQLFSGAAGFLPEDFAAIKGVVTALGFGAMMIIMMRMPGQSDQLVDDQSDINKQFQIDYVCPECKNFLGQNRPVEALLNMGKCPFCKSKFTR